MSNSQEAHGWQRVGNDRIWRHTKVLFLGSLLVFLINITLGFANVITPGAIPRWQILTHLHGGTIGWFTLSAVGFAVWLFTGNRSVTERYENRLQWLAWAAVLFGAGYVLSFGVSFSLTGNAFALLPVFGTGMMLVFWATAALTLTTLGKQSVLRNEHLLVAGAFIVASFGAIMGVLLGLQHAIGPLGLGENIPNTGSHAGPMDTYAIIVGTALIEWLVVRDQVTEWSWPGAIQALVMTVGGLVSFIPVEASAIGTPIALVGVIIFLVRIGWRAVLTNPFVPDARRWAVFAPLWFIVFIVLFLGPAFGFLPRDIEWFGPVGFHAYFVGYLTNALFGMLSGRTREGRTLHEWAEPGAFWLLNLGLVAFAASEIAYGGRHGAIVMGLGVLLGVATIGYRLLGEV